MFACGSIRVYKKYQIFALTLFYRASDITSFYIILSSFANKRVNIIALHFEMQGVIKELQGIEKNSNNHCLSWCVTIISIILCNR